MKIEDAEFLMRNLYEILKDDWNNGENFKHSMEICVIIT